MNKNLEKFIKANENMLRNNKFLAAAIKRKTGKSIDELIAESKNK